MKCECRLPKGVPHFRVENPDLWKQRLEDNITGIEWHFDYERWRIKVFLPPPNLGVQYSYLGQSFEFSV